MAKLDTQAGQLALDETLLAANQSHALGQSLSDREAQILLLIAAGRQNAEIAIAIGTDHAAVKQHIKLILRKAMASGRVAGGTKTNGLRPSELACEMASPFIA
jgi:DNA-binding CsgD family transcriptional regulator